MRRLIKLWQMIDDNILKILLIIFIFFIPLYPKFPLKIVEFTYIAIRMEDFYLLFIILIFTVQLLRKKVTFNKVFLLLAGLFWITAFFSFLISAYVTKTIDFPHLGFLHFARRIEYMIIFFIASSVVNSKKDFFVLFFSLFLSLFFVNSYGLGQRFFGLPAVSTMNPEFARGHLLYLTPEARLSSTFAGHYDLAAYLVFTIPLIFGFFFAVNKTKIYLLLLAIFSIVILVFTASRISFIAYIISTPLFILFLRRYKYFVFVLMLSLLVTSFSRDLTKRFLKTFQIKQIFVNEKTGQVYVPQKISTKELPAGSLYIDLKKQQITSKESSRLKEMVLKEATSGGKILTATEQAKLMATLSANLKPVSGVVYDISFSTRLQVEWPRAIRAFIKNPLFGTGPSSLTESTDNDYLRWLGEFGLIGFSIFLYLIFSIFYFIYVNVKKIDERKRTIFYAPLFSIFGLLINATYIDVFEASKMAYVFWYTLGVYIGFLSKKYENR